MQNLLLFFKIKDYLLISVATSVQVCNHYYFRITVRWVDSVIDFSINGLRTENRPLSQRNPTPYKISDRRK